MRLLVDSKSFVLALTYDALNDARRANAGLVLNFLDCILNFFQNYVLHFVVPVLRQQSAFAFQVFKTNLFVFLFLIVAKFATQ